MMITRRTLASLACLSLLSMTAEAAPADTIPQGRLPRQAVPVAYRLDLTLLPEQDHFSGHVEIDVDLKSATDTIWINGRGLAVRKVAALAPSAIIGEYRQMDAFGVARLNFPKKVPAGRVTIAVDYEASLGPGPGGAYRVKVADEWYAWTHFETIDARAAFPGFDQPEYKTPLTLTVTTAAGNLVVGNSPEIGVQPAGDLVRHSFAPTKPLPTYLMAFYVGPFATASTAAEPTAERATPLPVRVVATRPNAARLGYALRNTGPILSLLEDYFASPFPFDKLDQVASPIMQGGMENAGADLYGDQFLLVGDDSSTGQKQLFGEIVAHELSHQWFGDLVTPAWWDDVWLNESFANWMGFRIGDAWQPELGIRSNAVGDAFAAMDTDSLLAGRPIYQRIATNGEIADAFDEITYGKGAQVVGMIASYLGEDRFREGVRTHLKRRAGGVATSKQFFATLAEVAGDPLVVQSLKSFVDQQGVPVVAVKRVPGGLSLSQKPYAPLGSVPPAHSWVTPVCMSVDGKRKCTMLGGTPVKLAQSAMGVLMPNIDGAGYYRFSLSGEDWALLVAAAGTLPPGEALATTDSLWAAFRAGELPAASLLDEARSMSRNAYGSAATGPGRRLAELRRSGFIPSEDVAGLRRFIVSTYAPLLETVGFDARARAYEKESSDRRQLRSQLVSLVAFEGRDPTKLEALRTAASSYLAGMPDALDNSYLSAGLRAYAETASPDELGKLFERVLSSSDGFFRAQALTALGSVGRMDVAQLIEDHFSDTRFQSTERFDYVVGLFSEPGTRKFGRDRLSAHFQDLARNAPTFVASGLLATAGRSCSSEDAAASWANLHPMVVQDKMSPLSLRRAVERSRNCAALKKVKGAEMLTALRMSASR